MRSRLAGLLTLALCCGACASETPSPEPRPPEGDEGWGGTIERRGDTVFVRNPSAGLWDSATGVPLRFEPDGAFGGPGTQIESIGAAVVDDDANLYIVDRERGEIVSLAPDGSVRWRAGRVGSGVGELAGPRGAAYDGNASVWLVNQNGRRLDAWSLDGEPGRTIALPDLGISSAYMGGFLDPERLVLLSHEARAAAANAYVVLRLGDEAAVEGRFRVAAEPMTPIPPGVVMQLSNYFHDGRIYVGSLGGYVLRLFDGSGTLVRRVSRPADYLRGPGFVLLGDQYAGRSFGGLGAPIVLASGHWLTVASWPTNVADPDAFMEIPAGQRPELQWASSLDLFDAEGRFLYTIPSDGPVPEIGRPWAVGADGRLYTVSATPFPQVRRYRVVIDPPTGDP